MRKSSLGVKNDPYFFEIVVNRAGAFYAGKAAVAS
jgi:hypothetical protein